MRRRQLQLGVLLLIAHRLAGGDQALLVGERDGLAAIETPTLARRADNVQRRAFRNSAMRDGLETEAQRVRLHMRHGADEKAHRIAKAIGIVKQRFEARRMAELGLAA